MLSMKTLRVAAMAMGSALLLGPGMALAATQQLDGEGKMAAKTVMYATESLGMPTLTVGAAKYYPLMSPSGPALQVDTNRSIEMEESVWLRVGLSSGMVFGASPASLRLTGTGIKSTERVISGGNKDDYVVFKVESDGMGVDGSIGNDSTIRVRVTDALAVMAGQGTYAATITAHRNVDDAILGQNQVDTMFYGGAAIVGFGSALSGKITMGKAAVADVVTGYLWFTQGGMNTNVATLGSVDAAVNTMTNDLLDAGTGAPVTARSLDLEYSTTVMGDFSIGAFNLMRAEGTDMSGGCGMLSGSKANPATGNLAPAKGGDMMMATKSHGLSTQYLCVKVDTMGAMTNTMAIPETEYMATLNVTLGKSLTDKTKQVVMEVASGKIGEIKRNGTTVNIAYLTALPAYDQRLVIVNRGPRDAMYSLMGFTPEYMSDAMVDMKMTEGHSGMVPKGSQVNIKVGDVLHFMGEDAMDKARTSAVLRVAAPADEIQVFTTQVSLQSGNTDTVLYASEGSVQVTTN